LLLTKCCLKYALLAPTHSSLISWRAPERKMTLTRIKLPERQAELEKGIGTIGLLIWPIEQQNAIVISDTKKASIQLTVLVDAKGGAKGDEGEQGARTDAPAFVKGSAGGSNKDLLSRS
jgi:hypothetical protein